MKIIDAIEKRCSTRKFQEKQISKEELDIILEAARMAPSGKNERSNKIYVLQNKETIQRLNDVLIEAVKRGNAIGVPADAKFVDNYSFCYNAPTFLLMTHKKDSINEFADAGCLMENAMLQATELGIGTCWINLVRRGQKDPEVQKILKDFGMGEDEIVTGSLSVGYPVVPFKQKINKTGNEVVFVP